MLAGDFPETVMKTVDKYVPQNQCLFYNQQLKSEQLKSEELLSKSQSSKKQWPSARASSE